mgnify:CR=1 FL=1
MLCHLCSDAEPDAATRAAEREREDDDAENEVDLFAVVEEKPERHGGRRGIGHDGAEHADLVVATMLAAKQCAGEVACGVGSVLGGCGARPLQSHIPHIEAILVGWRADFSARLKTDNETG